MCEIYLLIKNKLEPFILVYKYVTFNRKQQFLSSQNHAVSISSEISVGK